MSRMTAKKRRLRLAALARAESRIAATTRQLQNERKEADRAVQNMAAANARLQRLVEAAHQEAQKARADAERIREAIVCLRTMNRPEFPGRELELRTGRAYGEPVRAYRQIIDERVIEFGRVPPEAIVKDVVDQAMHLLFNHPRGAHL